MKPKNQIPLTSENDAKEKLIIYVYEYLVNSGAKNAAESFLTEINYGRSIIPNDEGIGFLAGWWYVFWDLYCASSDKKPGQAEPSSEARAFHDFNRRSVPGLSPQCAPNTSPSGPIGGFMPGCGGPPMMGGARYGAPYPNHQMRPSSMNVGGPRMVNMMTQGGPPPPQPQMVVGPPSQPPHQGPMMGSPRYVPHNGHMTPGSSASGPVNEPGPSPGVNRMTPNHSGSPHAQQVGPPNGMSPMAGPMGGPHGAPPPQVQQMGGPGGPIQGMQPRNGPPGHNWQNNFSVNSPADQQFIISGPPISSSQQNDFGPMLMNDGAMMDVKGPNNNGPPNQNQDDYGIPYGQQEDQGEDTAQMMKMKEPLENSAKDYDPDETGLGLEYSETPAKW